MASIRDHLHRLNVWLGAMPKEETVWESTLIVARQGVAKLTLDELRAIGHVRSSDPAWPGLVGHCFNYGPDRPSQTDELLPRPFELD